jgi:predicted dehydrogenase
MIRIGIVGIGFMGWTHFAAACKINAAGKPSGSKLKGAAVTAICTRSPAKLAGDWTSIQGNFGPRGPQLDLSRLSAYDQVSELLADPEIDLIDVCLPNDQHEAVVLQALQAGKHVLVEKPIAVDPKAADRMVSAAAKANRMLQVAHVLPFFPEFQFVRELVSSQKYGKLQAAHLRRVITPPKWSGDMSDFRKLGGWGIDLHIHDNHFLRLLCGQPLQVFSQGLLQDGFVNHVHTQYVFSEPGLAVSAVSGGIAAPGLEFAHGYEFYFEKATLLFAAGTIGGAWVVDRPLTVVTGGKVSQPKLKGGTEWCSAFTSELQTAVDAVATGVPAPLLSGELARDALKICHAEAKSIATGKPVRL